MTLLPDLRNAVIDAAERHGARRTDQGGQNAVRADAATQRPVPRRADLAVDRTSRPRRRLRSIGAAAVLGVVGLLVALVIGTGNRHLDPVVEARAALVPSPGSILHLDVLTDTTAYDARGRRVPKVGQAALTLHQELWISQDPLRWRLLVHASRARSDRDGGRPLQPRTESAWADGASSYLEQGGSLGIVTGLSPRSSANDPHLGRRPGLSTDAVRRALATGALRSVGPVQADGRRLHRFSGRLPRGSSWPGTVDYDVDPATFAPARITLRQRLVPPSRWFAQMVTRIAIRRQERLALDARTAELLSIQPPPGTRTITRTLEEQRAFNRVTAQLLRLPAAEKRR